MKEKYEELDVYTDGASRGNPGDAAWGYLILEGNEQTILKQSGYLGRSTNNQAEYFAVIRSLQRAGGLTDGTVNLHSDSKLLVNQVTENWKVKNTELKRLYKRVKSEEENFKSVNFFHVPRENEYVALADQLCNDRLDEIQNS